MTDHVHQHFHKHRNLRAHGRAIPSMRCKSGFELSIQASTAHYCTPRLNEGPYLAVECMFFTSTKIPKTWKQFMASPDEWGAGALFFNVPVAILNSWIELHGGPAE